MKPEDTIENVLDRLDAAREELLSIQRSLERMQRGERQDGFAKADAAPRWQYNFLIHRKV